MKLQKIEDLSNGEIFDVDRLLTGYVKCMLLKQLFSFATPMADRGNVFAVTQHNFEPSPWSEFWEL